jgi:hypothetical protein
VRKIVPFEARLTINLKPCSFSEGDELLSNSVADERIVFNSDIRGRQGSVFLELANKQ